MNALFSRPTIVLAGLLALSSARCLAESETTITALETAQKASGQQQYAAIDDLGERHELASAVVPQLQKLLQSKDPQVRWRSARALGDYEGLAAAAAGDLRKLLADKDPVIQYHAVVALGRVEDRSDETVRALIAAVTSNDARVARAAVAALRNLKPGPERVMQTLSEALRSNDSAVTLYAMEAIIERGGEAAPILIEALKRPETAYLACAAIEQIGPDAAPTVPALTELLGKTKHSKLLVQALLALASIGPEAISAEPKILPLLEHTGDSAVAAAAAYALGSIRAENAEEELRAALAKDNPLFQMIAAWALAKLHPEDKEAMQLAVDKLTAGLGSSDARMRTAAAHSLDTLDAPPEIVAPALLKIANDPDPNVEANVVGALASLGERIVPRATNALKMPDRRNLAVKVLTRMGPKAAGAVPALLEATKGADNHFATEINFAFAAIGSAAAPATDTLAKAVGSSDQGVRESALYALRRIGPAANAAVPTLTKKLSDTNSFEAAAAAWALANIAPGDKAVAAKAVPVLIKALAAPDDQTQMESADALAAFGSAAASATEALKKAAANEGSPEVRAAAQAALKRIGAGR
jgi:HEAT repeat protein